MKECEFAIDFKAALNCLGDLVNHFNNHNNFNNHNMLKYEDFFHFKLDESSTIKASLMVNGEIRVYVDHVVNYPRKIMIGVLSNNMIVQNPIVDWPMSAIMQHEHWPECLVALNNAAIVLSVMLT